MWLLEPETMALLREAKLAGWQPTADQQAQIVAQLGRNEDGSPRILTKAGNTASIAIHGVLTAQPDILALILGGGNTIYSDIQQALADADQDSSVEQIEMLLDTPGGSVSGLMDTLLAIQAVQTPVTARVGNQAASAGFILASQADEITASTSASGIGSFGVAAAIRLQEDVVQITNSQSPDKRPDVTTEEGKQTVQKYLDSLHDLFAQEVARGRGVDKRKAMEDFGRGAMFLADQAVSAGMIDRVENTASPMPSAESDEETSKTQPEPAPRAETTPAPRATKHKPEAPKMDLATLKAQHPDVYDAAVKEGVDQERDRAGAFLEAGKMAGDYKAAHEDIANGVDFSNVKSMEYLRKAQNNADISGRDQDREDTDAAADAGAAPNAQPNGEDDEETAVQDAVAASLGYDFDAEAEA